MSIQCKFRHDLHFCLSIYVYPISPWFNNQLNNLEVIPKCFTLTIIFLFKNNFSMVSMKNLTYLFPSIGKVVLKSLLHKARVSSSQHFKKQIQNKMCWKVYLIFKSFSCFHNIFSFYWNSFTKNFTYYNIMLITLKNHLFITTTINFFSNWWYNKIYKGYNKVNNFKDFKIPLKFFHINHV